MELWQLWLLATLDGWIGLAQAIIGLFGVFLMFSAIVAAASEGDWNAFTKFPRAIKAACGAAVVSALVMVLVPSSKQAWLMIGAYVGINAAQEIATNPEVQKLPPNVMRAMNKFLEQYVEPIKETK